MRFVIVTGMSGAGKRSVIKMLEDQGYFCVDNLPVKLIPTFMQLTRESGEKREKVALGVDIRSGKAITGVAGLLDELREEGHQFEVLFMDCSTSVLVKRYKETRRLHPLTQGGRVDAAIEEERKMLEPLRKQADHIIDTSRLLIRELKQETDRIFVENLESRNFYVTFVSFGFKYGIPTDADLVFDVRFLPNPYYIPAFRPKTGNDREVYDYVRASDKSDEFLEKLQGMLEFLIPNYEIEGKTQLVVGIGCTGGKHRSVTMTNAIYEIFENSEYACRKEHRDIEKDRMR